MGDPVTGPPHQPGGSSPIRKLILFAIVIAVTLGAAAGVLSARQHVGPSVTVDKRPVPPPPPVPVGTPVRISIPAVGIDSRTVVPVGLDKRGAVATPCDPEKPWVRCNVSATGWYAGSALPGAPGDAVIDGHVDWYGPPPTYGPDIAAIFTNLHRTKVGDEVVVVDALGHTRVFTVDAVTTLPYPQAPAGMYATSGKPSVTLVTCAGVFKSVATGLSERVYVHASLTSG